MLLHSPDNDRNHGEETIGREAGSAIQIEETGKAADANKANQMACLVCYVSERGLVSAPKPAARPWAAGACVKAEAIEKYRRLQG